MPELQLGPVLLNEASEPYVIAEIGVNHGGSLDLAKRLIELAKEGGADAAKFQTYKAETLASRHSPAYWDLEKEATTSQFELFKRYDLFGPDEYRALAVHCDRVGIQFLSTPFDTAAVEFLAPLMTFFKIASADLTNIPLLRQVSAYGKPVVLSTGASTLGEVERALAELAAAGSERVALLHCILNYPTDEHNAHLAMITGLRRAFPDHLIGYSDHTRPDADMLPLTTAYLLGARIIEKHFTHDKSLPGNDHYHAMDVDDLRAFRVQVARIRTLLGPTELKKPIATESISRANARRSLVLTQDVDAGTALTEAMLVPKRPGTGVSPAHWDEVIGSTLRRALRADDVLQWADVEQA